MEDKKIPYLGLSNFGNSCYFNSSIQFLKPVFDTLALTIECDQNIFEIVSSYYKNYYNTHHLRNKYNYICNKIKSNYGQQDSDEAILVFLDDILSIPNKDIKKIFDFSIKYKHLVKCSKCKKFKICNDGNDQIDNVLISKYFTQNIHSHNTTNFNDFLGSILYRENADDDLIKTFKNETLCTCDNKYITIETVLTDMPKFLIIYINRCSSNVSYKKDNRLQIANKFEITTPKSLEEYCINKNLSNILHTYDLYGIIIHSGRSISGGHYYAYSKNVQTNDWYNCNDSTVTKIDNFNLNDEYIQSNCSALLYIKKN